MNLGTGLRAVFLGEENVVILAGVEGRVEVDKIDRLVLDVALEDFEVIAVIEPVLLSSHRVGMRLTQGWGPGLKGGSRSFLRRDVGLLKNA
jgi:hypothetical protein